MGINFKVSMVLEAVNRMEGGIRGAINSANRLKDTLYKNSRETANLNPVAGWAGKINQVTGSAKRLGEQLKSSGKSLSEAGEKMQHNGFRNVAEGTGMLAPIMDMANKAAALQMKQTSMQLSGISATGTDQLIQRADKYTERTLFSKTEIADMFLSMRQSGMKENNIFRGSEPMVMLAELENVRRGTMGTETAKVLAQMAERGGILQDPNIERWNEFLELVNRVTTVTTAGIPELHESSTYLEPVARAAGWSEQDMMWSQGVAARFGLEGSVAGTDLKDMVARLNPLKWYKEGRPDQHLDAMNRLGWLQGVQSHVNKSNRTVYDGIGGSVMLKEDGSTVDMMTMFGQFAKSWERYKNLPQGRAKFAADMFKVLGEQGEKTALLVSQNYEVIEQMMEDAGKVQSIHEQIDAYSNQYLQNYKAFKSAVSNLEIDVGNTFLPAGADFIQNSLRPWIASLREFTKEHPGFVSAVAKGIAVIGGLKIGTGVFKLVLGTLTTTFGGTISGAGTLFGWMGKLGVKAIGLRDGFKYFRGKDGKFFESIWKGAQWSLPWLGKLTGWVSTFTPLWLTNAARIAAGWLIAMGPVGWIILAVTGTIAAGVLAWKTNFLGFRDTSREVFAWIKDYAEFTCPGISVAFKEMADKSANEWNWLKGEANKAMSAMENEAKWVCASMGISFDGVTEKVQGFIKSLWNAQPAVMLYDKIVGHFQQFDRWRERRQNMEQRDLLASKEYILPRMDGTSGDFNQTNNITLPNADIASEFVQRSTPPKYSLANPDFNF